MIELIKQAWDELADEGLADALGDTLPVVAHDVASGRCELWQVKGYGYAVTCLEQRLNGLVLVILAGQKQAGAQFCYEDSLKAFCNLAANIGAVAVEMQTHRPGIGRIVQRLGFEEVARRYSFDIEAAKHGQQ